MVWKIPYMPHDYWRQCAQKTPKRSGYRGIKCFYKIILNDRKVKMIKIAETVKIPKVLDITQSIKNIELIILSNVWRCCAVIKLSLIVFTWPWMKHSYWIVWRSKTRKNYHFWNRQKCCFIKTLYHISQII